jgi:hypothetical protein
VTGGPGVPVVFLVQYTGGTYNIVLFLGARNAERSVDIIVRVPGQI